jgi:hypothetical protein
MFVRGLQGTYNQYAPQMGISIPHGDIILFGLCCGQIMYAFLLAPDTLSREYYNWIQSASGVPKYAVASNRTAVRHNLIAPAQLQKALREPRVSASAQTMLIPRALPCATRVGGRAGTFHGKLLFVP